MEEERLIRARLTAKKVILPLIPVAALVLAFSTGYTVQMGAYWASVLAFALTVFMVEGSPGSGYGRCSRSRWRAWRRREGHRRDRRPACLRPDRRCHAGIDRPRREVLRYARLPGPGEHGRHADPRHGGPHHPRDGDPAHRGLRARGIHRRAGTDRARLETTPSSPLHFLLRLPGRHHTAGLCGRVRDVVSRRVQLVEDRVAGNSAWAGGVHRPVYVHL